MRFYGLALLASAAVLGACGGGGDKAKDTTAAAPAAPTAAAPAAPAAGGKAPMPATGDTVTIKMVGDDKGYRFEPNAVSIKEGQAVKFVMTTGGPHNVAFDPATTPAGGKDQLNANMTGQLSELSSPILMNPNEAYTISFAGVAPGKYDFHCTPHLAMNMKGTITVQ
ncbi:MAG: plastocyanin/azurin family copper-binding protein [Gemmatimonadaceae bacterium]